MPYCLSTKIAEMIKEYAGTHPLSDDAKGFIFSLVEQVGKMISIHDANMIALRIYKKGFDLKSITEILSEEEFEEMLDFIVIH
jgi:hypothetical protein